MSREVDVRREASQLGLERDDFARSARAVSRFERSRRARIDALLDWVDALRDLFGDPPVNPRSWRGSDFRL